MQLPLTITEVQSRLLKKEFSAMELVDSYLARIEKFNPELNAFLTVSKERAYGDAKKVDEILQQCSNETMKRYPLLGVTVAYKDLFLTKGIRTTAASKVLEDYVPAYSATVVERIQNAGAICLGKTNCDAWAHGSSGENSDFSPTKNPWNGAYVPGGSSSGSAASLAANLSLVATGTDTCGSIRLPANYSFCYGLKPTYGAVSRYGVVAMASSLDCVGPMSRNINDIELLFNVIKGEDGHDGTVKSAYSLQTTNYSKKKLKIGMPKEFFQGGLDKEVEENIQKAIKVFEKEGVEIKKVSLPSTKHAFSVYYIIQPAEVSSNLGRYDGIRYGNDRSTFGDEAKRRIMLGTYVLSSGYYDQYYLKAMKVRSILIKEVNKVFDLAADGVDAIITPVAPTPPFKLGEKASDPLKMYLTDIFAATANLVGIPSLAIPFNFTKSGLPLGFQLMGPQFSEYTLFKFGKLFEKATEYKPKITNL
jgi:aspartyl-tRNA(Asn)/glutamyl-tRNA(Gln) amidotransferase subunit A